MTARCPYCGVEASTPGEEQDHMTSAHPEVVESRLLEAGVARFELPLLGQEVAVARAVISALCRNVPYAVRGPKDTRRGGAFEMLVPGEDRERVYRVDVSLQRTDPDAPMFPLPATDPS